MKNELVSFKGTAYGVRVCVDDVSPMFNILEELDRKINSNKKFFGDGNCRVFFYGRSFTGGERQRLEQLVNGLLPLSKVEFEIAKKNTIHNQDWIEEYKKRYSKETEDIKEFYVEDADEKEVKNEEYEFLSVFKSSRARFYQGTVQEGMKMSSDGHLVLLGTVEQGGSLEAVGNIIVIGGLYGEAYAGCNGHNGSYIMAIDMMPQKLSIADTTEEYDYSENKPEEKEPTQNTETNRIRFFEKFKKKNNFDEKNENNTPKTEKTAVALCKNHKIILDNFTIQAFTNLKNMI